MHIYIYIHTHTSTTTTTTTTSNHDTTNNNVKATTMPRAEPVAGSTKHAAAAAAVKEHYNII